MVPANQNPGNDQNNSKGAEASNTFTVFINKIYLHFIFWLPDVGSNHGPND